MRRSATLTFALLVSFAPLATHAAEPLKPGDFRLRLPLTIAQPDGLHAVELSEAIYRAGTSRGLDDLRVFNANGESLPWAVLPALTFEPRTGPPIELALVPLPEDTEHRATVMRSYSVRIERDTSRASVEITPLQPVGFPSGGIGGYLIDARRGRDRSGQLELTFDAAAADYAQRIDIMGSDDLVTWRPVLSGSLVLNRKLGAAVERNSFDLSRPPSFLRVQWTGPAPQLAAARFLERFVEVETMPRIQLPVLPDEHQRGSFLVDIPAALPIERLLLRPVSINESYPLDVYARATANQPVRRHFLSHRRTDGWSHIARIDVTHVLRGGKEVTGAPLQFSIATDRLRLSPIGTSRLGHPPQVEAEWRPARIAFLAKAPGPYIIAIGRPAAPPPAPLAVAHLLPPNDAAGGTLPAARIHLGAVDEVIIKAAERQRSQRIAAQAHWSRYALWAALIAAVGVLSWMAWRLFTQMPRRQSADRPARAPQRSQVRVAPAAPREHVEAGPGSSPAFARPLVTTQDRTVAGYCPNCSCPIESGENECPLCGALFGRNSAWQPQVEPSGPVPVRPARSLAPAGDADSSPMLEDERPSRSSLLSGFWLSVPAALLIWGGFADGTDPTAWRLWGMAFLLGLPWNLIILAVGFIGVLGLALLQVHLPISGEVLVGFGLAGIVLAGTVGAHINGVFLARFRRSRAAKRRRLADTPDSLRSRS